MNDPEQIAEAKADIERYREKLLLDPDNFFLKKMLEMAENRLFPKPYKPMRLPEIEEEDPLVAGRAGECDVALESLLEFYPHGIPHRLTSDGSDYAHVFLMLDGVPVDICGVTDPEEMKAHFKDDSMVSEPADLIQIRKYFQKHRNPDEARRYRSLFKQYIQKNIGGKFPAPK